MIKIDMHIHYKVKETATSIELALITLLNIFCLGSVFNINLSSNVFY